MMRPQPASSIPSITCLVTLNREFRLVLMTAFQSSSDILRNTPSRVMPALFTRIEGIPSSPRIFSKAARVDSQSATLPTEA